MPRPCDIPATALLGIIAAAASAQPSLTPPPGSIAPSGRDGTRIELSQSTAPGDTDSVFRVIEPGSYVLTADVNAPANTTGIEVAASNVTIDLNGYSVNGSGPTSTGVGIGVQRWEQGAFQGNGLRVFNGFIKGFETGIDLNDAEQFNAVISRFEDVEMRDLVIRDVREGIEGVSRSKVAGCIINAQDLGIRLNNAVITDCAIVIQGGAAGGTGVFGESGLIISRVTVEVLEFAGGVYGFDVLNSNLSGCHATLFSADTQSGIRATSSLVTDCHVQDQGGIRTGNGFELIASQATTCRASGFAVGYLAVADSTMIRGCMSSANTTALDTTNAPNATLIENGF